MAEKLSSISKTNEEVSQSSDAVEDANLKTNNPEEPKAQESSQDDIKENGGSNEGNEEEEVVQVFIESDDEETAQQDIFNRNGGLPYGDHNYDIFDKSKKSNNYSDVEFPILGPLDEDGNILPEQSTEAEPQNIDTQQPTGQSPQIINQQTPVMQRTVTLRQYPQPLQQDHQRSEPSIVARAPAHRDGNVYRVTTQSETPHAYGGYPSTTRSYVMPNRGISNSANRGRSSDLSQGGQSFYGSGQQNQGNVMVRATIQQRRPTNLQSGTPGGYQHLNSPSNPAVRRNPVSAGTRSTLLGTRTAIRQTHLRAEHDPSVLPTEQHLPQHHSIPQQPMIPANVVQRRPADVAPHRMTADQRMQQLQASQSRPSHYPVLEGGIAPMLIPGRGNKVVVRGRSGSMGTKRREEEQGQLSQQSIPHGSPQKTQYDINLGNQNLNLESRAVSSSPRKVPPPDTYSIPVAKVCDQLPAQLTEDPIVDSEHQPTTSTPADVLNNSLDNSLTRNPITPTRNLSPAKPIQSQSLEKPTPPHRMTREEKSAHIAKHMEKEMSAPATTTPVTSSPQSVPQPASVPVTHLQPRASFTSPLRSQVQPSQDQKPFNVDDDHVAKVVAEVAAAAAHANKCIDQSSKEKDEISKLANDLRISAESFTTSPNSSQNTLSQRQSDDVMVQNKMAIAKREIEQEKAMGADLKKRRGPSGDSQNVTPEASTHRPRGRPKGKTSNRNQSGVQDGEKSKQGAPRGVRTLPPVQRAAPLPKADETIMDQKDSDSESDGVKNDDEYGDSWTMRCHCGMKHGTGHCVECEKCENWQHTLCMGLKPTDNLDGYQCEKCQPRVLPISKQEAIRIQKKELKKLVAKKEKGRRSKKSTPVPDDIPDDSLKPPYVDANEYSRSATKLLKSLSPTIGASDLLKNAKKFPRAKRMFVSENVEGLVSTEYIAAHAIVMELNGYICMMDESTRDPGGSVHVFQYDGLMKGPHGEDIGNPVGDELVVIDARKRGNDAKYMRRSCTPNCVLKHVLDDNYTLGVLVVSNECLQYNTEITIPFDNDFRYHSDPLHCAEHSGSEITNCRYEIERLTRRMFKIPVKAASPVVKKTPAPAKPKSIEPKAAKETVDSKTNEEGSEQETPTVEERTRRLSSRAEAVRAREKEKEDEREREKERQKEREIAKAKEREEKAKKKEKEREEREKQLKEEEEKEKEKAKEKEESSKISKKSATPKRVDKERTPTPVSSEKPKLSREDRMAQQYEILFQKQEEKLKRRSEKEKLKNQKSNETEQKNSAKKGSGSKRKETVAENEKEVKEEIEEEEEKPKPEPKKKIPRKSTTTKKDEVDDKDIKPETEEAEEPKDVPLIVTPTVEKRTSARVARLSMSSTTSDSSQKETKPVAETSTKSRRKRETESDTEKGFTPLVQPLFASATPPTKRVRKESAAENSIVESSPRKSARRNNSESTAASTSSVKIAGSSPSPAKKTRKAEEKPLTCGDVLKMMNDALQNSLKVIKDFDECFKPGKDEKPSKKARQAQEILSRNREMAEKSAEAGKPEPVPRVEDKAKEALPSNEESPSTSSKDGAGKSKEKSVPCDEKIEEEKPKKVQKKLSVADYKARKSTAAASSSGVKDYPPNKPSCSSQKEGFIPSTEGSDNASVSLTPISLESKSTFNSTVDAEASDDLKRLMMLQNKIKEVDGSSGNDETVKTPQSSNTGRTSESDANPVTTADESPQHKMSLKDRLFSEFGLGTGQQSTSSSSNDRESNRSRSSRWQ